MGDIRKENYNSRFRQLENLDDNELTYLEPDDLIDFKDHIFTRYSDDMLQELMNSIEDIGLLVPILCREHPNKRGKFEILSGHNRVEACRRLGIKEIPVRVFSDITENEAKLIVIETNIKQRNFSEFKPSVRAAIVSEWHNLMKKQGLRSDLIRDTEDPQILNMNEKNTPFQLGKSQIANYVRIHRFLLDELKDMLDSGVLTIKSCVELTFLDQDEQTAVFLYIEDGNNINESKAKILRRESMDNFVSLEYLEKLFEKKVKLNNTRKDIKVPAVMVEKYFKDFNESEITKILQMAIELYFEKQ